MRRSQSRTSSLPLSSRTRRPAAAKSCVELGARAVLATPIVVFDQMIGTFVLHRSQIGIWPDEEVKLAEAVAREVGLATHAARLLRESENRLDHLSTLIKAAQFVSAELRLDTVLQRLVGEVTSLLDADAADCYLHDADRGIIRCVAVHGLDPDLVGFEAPREQGLAGVAFRERRSVVSHDYARIAEDFPNPVYESFKSALVAPMTVGDEVLGMLGVGSRRSRAGDSTRPTARRSRLSPAWPRSRSTMPRASRSANAGAGSSAASSSWRLRSPSRSHSRKPWTPSRRRPPRHSAAASPRC